MSRPRYETLIGIATSVAAVLAAMLISLILIAASGHDPLGAARAMWSGAFGGRNQIAGTLTKMTPLALAALAWVITITARRINVGLEGQMLAGGVLAAIVGLKISSLPLGLHLPLSVLAGAVGGAALGGLAAWLWARRNVNDLIVTLLLNFVMIQLVSWLALGPLEEPTGTLGQSEPVQQSARWPVLLSGTILRWDVLLVVIGAIGVGFALRSTLAGFRLRLTGSNERAAVAAGINTRWVGAGALMMSAGVAGVAGSSLILASPSGNLAPGFSSNYGFDGIVVALLARNSVAGCLPAALLLAALRQGGGLMEAREGISSGLVTITQALVIIIVTGTVWLVRRRRVGGSRPEDGQTESTPGRADDTTVDREMVIDEIDEPERVAWT